VSYIEIIEEDKAEGLLAQIYEAARRRAGRVYNILKVQSQNPAALHGMLEIYQSVMLGPSPLSRGQREMLAVVVSKANDCHY
jgi:uncharacterized peroxidase-related enzyme